MGGFLDFITKSGGSFAAPKWLKVPHGTPIGERGYPNFDVKDLQIPPEAQRLGYNNLVFHSTRSVEPFEQFNPAAKNPAAARAGLPSEFGTHVGSLEAARDRAELYGMSTGIIPLLMRARNPAEIKDLTYFSASDIARALKNEGYLGREANRVISANPTAPQELAQDRLLQILKAKKIDSLRYKNTMEGPGEYSYVGFSPNQFRVPWAKFDPTKSSSGNIYAGVGAAGAALPAASQYLYDPSKFQEAQ